VTLATRAGQALALRVLARESTGSGAAATLVAAEHVLDRLHGHLAPWVGRDGFHALFTRALSRARDSHPILADVSSEPRDGHRLDALGRRIAAGDELGMTEALVALVAALFTLLVRLIGDEMVARLTYQIWPEEEPAARSTENKDHIL